jgi:hypothetical protein
LLDRSLDRPRRAVDVAVRRFEMVMHVDVRLHDLRSYGNFCSMTSARTTDDCAIYVLDVPEFSTLVAALRDVPGISIEKHADYFVARAPGEIVVQRRTTGVGQAVWFGALTGGIRGRIVTFSEDELRVAPLTADR